MEDVLPFSLSFGDELWHVVLYQWLIDNALTDRLLEIKSPHLEAFLKRSSSQQQPSDLNILDLLWRYYEKTKNYSAAARVLSRLSEKESNSRTEIGVPGSCNKLRDSLQSSPSDRMAVVSKKIAYLGKVYVHSERYFPLGAIILMLEKKSSELVWDPS
ncbi:hypothetical protein OS493_029753 [Desmophyllum pertusum]|uniref:Nucleoporin Nup133/Nup155-like C-terminal domain-containing protein n=1 Tax=Desmophyllum pertusum TaxID=174260 RepID=A0A9W9Z059_9CNID|nr:hypothetical protein OS493_029753 [Desmophyllum pertusum]